MGYPENKKLAKDINKNTGECTDKLEALLSSLNSQLGLMNTLISSISGGYVSKDYVDSAMPTGVILMWSGSIDTIPTGFALCNGMNGTPDLRDRFIIGAGGSYVAHTKGGTATVDLSHTHAYSGTTDGSGSSGVYASAPGVSVSAQNHTHTYSGTTESAGNESTSILPPYYALCFIMKTGTV